MASTTVSFAIDKYSFCDVPMSHPDAKPTWHHHPARDHIYLVLQYEGPLEQPSDLKFPGLTKLTLKVIWRAETLEVINISDVLNQKSGYVDFLNIVCMIRSPSMALKYVNLRGHTLRRMQVRFCKQEDFQSVVSSLERVGCPIQHHNGEAGQASQQQKAMRPPYERPDTATSLLSAGGPVQYSRPGTGVSQLALTPVEHRTPLFPHGTGLGTAPQPHRQYMGVQPLAQESPQIGYRQQLVPRHENPTRFSVQSNVGSSPPPRPMKQSASHSRQTSISLDHFQHQRRLSFTAQAEPYTSPTPHFNSHLSAPQKPVNPFEAAYHNHLRRDSGTISPFTPHAHTDPVVPVSRGTITSAGTLMDQSSQPAEPFPQDQVIPSSQPFDFSQSQPHLRTFPEDESLPPRRLLPDFEKINKVHGDKPLPSSSGKISTMFKTSKNSRSSTPTLKRKESYEDPEVASTAAGNLEKPPAKRTKVAAAAAAPVKKKTTVPKPTPKVAASQNPAASQKGTAAASKPKKPRVTTAKSKKPVKTATPMKPQSETAAQVSPTVPLQSSPWGTVLQDATPSKLNTQLHPPTTTEALRPPAKAASKQTKPKPAGSGKAAMLQEVNGDVDEKLLSQMLSSDKHLVMLEKLEGVWVRMGFKARIQASVIMGDRGHVDKDGERLKGKAAVA